jgi:hypothetical protein
MNPDAPQFLSIGPAIVERLKSRCPAAAGNVFSTRDLGDVEESKQVTPALHVVLHGYHPEETRAGTARWREDWLIIAVVRHSARSERAAALTAEGAELARQAFYALSGWLPPGLTVPLAVSEGPRPGFSETHAYFPLAFAATTHTLNQNKRP